MPALRTWTKDPSARLDYSWDWSEWLTPTDGINTVSFSYLPNDGTLIIEPPTVNGGMAMVMISGGTVGRTYMVTGHLTTIEGREDDRSRRIIVQQR